MKDIGETMTDAEIKPLASLRVSSHQIPGYEMTPNTSIQGHPLLVYHECFGSTCSPAIIEKHLEEIAVVAPQWTYTMYSTSHFHSTTHEVLCISQGSAELQFGGEDNPGKVETTVHKGDVIIVPAGVSHRLLRDIHGDFQMVGSYPPGTHWDMCYGREKEKDKLEGIKHLSWFKRDPIYGDEGPALNIHTS